MNTRPVPGTSICPELARQLRQIEHPHSDLVLIRNAQGTKWILCRRRPDGGLFNLASPEGTLKVITSNTLADGAGDPVKFLERAAQRDRACRIEA